MTFRLIELPVVDNFVDRDIEMKQIEYSLLVSNTSNRRRIHVLHGLDGIEKTQLVIAFARKHQQKYTAILWLNDNSRDTLVQNLAVFAKHAKIDETRQSIDDTVEQSFEQRKKTNVVLEWLVLDENRRWLFVFDNVDRDYQAKIEDQQTYDIEFFFSSADHGFVLITTRLFHFEEHESTTKVTNVNQEQVRQILKNNVRRCLFTQNNRVSRASC